MNKQSQFERKAKSISAFFTLIIGAVLMGILLISFNSASLPTEQEGMIIDFGYDLSGLGLEEPSYAESSAQISGGEQKVENQIITQSDEESVVIKETKKDPSKSNTNNTSKNNQTNNNQETKIDNNQTYKGDKKFEGNGSSEGTLGGDGNQGDPSGDPNGGLGGEGNNPAGIGVGHDLKGRSVIKRSLSSTSLEPGKIVFKITVDKNGYIKSATYERSGSTIVDQSVINQVKNQLVNKQWFQPKSDAPENQNGILTVNIVLS